MTTPATPPTPRAPAQPELDTFDEAAANAQPQSNIGTPLTAPLTTPRPSAPGSTTQDNAVTKAASGAPGANEGSTSDLRRATDKSLAQIHAQNTGAQNKGDAGQLDLSRGDVPYTAKDGAKSAAQVASTVLGVATGIAPAGMSKYAVTCTCGQRWPVDANVANQMLKNPLAYDAIEALHLEAQTHVADHIDAYIANRKEAANKNDAALSESQMLGHAFEAVTPSHTLAYPITLPRERPFESDPARVTAKLAAATEAVLHPGTPTTTKAGGAGSVAATPPIGKSPGDSSPSGHPYTSDEQAQEAQTYKDNYASPTDPTAPNPDPNPVAAVDTPYPKAVSTDPNPTDKPWGL